MKQNTKKVRVVKASKREHKAGSMTRNEVAIQASKADEAREDGHRVEASDWRFHFIEKMANVFKFF
jgi:hypothetical protein